MFVWIHSVFGSWRWPKKLHRISEDIIGTSTDMVLEQRQYVSRTFLSSQNKLDWFTYSQCVTLSILQTWLLVARMTGRTTSASNTPSHLSSRTVGATASSCHHLTFPRPAMKLWSLWRLLLSRLYRKRKLQQVLLKLFKQLQLPLKLRVLK